MVDGDSGQPGQPAGQAGTSKDADPGSGRAALLGAITTLVATLTLIATVNGEIARMFRNHQFATTLALTLELIAILCGLLTQVRLPRLTPNLLLAAGSVALVMGMGFAIVAEIRTLGLSDRPTIAATEVVSGGIVNVKAHVAAHKAKAHDQIVVVAYGLTLDNKRVGAVYYAKSGPTTEGELIQDVEIVLSSRTYGGIYLSAVIVPEHVLPPEVDCDGYIVNADGTNLTEVPAGGGPARPVAFRPGGESPLVACLTVNFPAAAE